MRLKSPTQLDPRKRCPYCQDAVQPHDRVSTCEECGGQHHQECWRALGRCGACDSRGEAAAGGVEQDPEPRVQVRARPPRAHQERVALPKGHRVTETDSALEISRRWLSLLNLSVAFELPLSVVLFYAARKLVFGLDPGASAQAWVVPMTLLAIALVLAYHSACSLLNHTVLRVTPQALTLEHRPLPWPGGKRFPATAIEQLTCESVHHSSRHGGGGRFTYSLYVLDSKGNKACLLSGLLFADQARFAEQEIERFLGISDDPPAPGER